ncbi:MAG: hypothetical protein J7576_14515 [Siphonobacter aquaeclarae]|nr:hypothetical protein [Siphonobacter aquaeclarae]
MKNWICLLLLAAPATDISSFHWLAGTWKNVKTGEFEEWKRVGNEWKGRSYTVAGKDTTVSEKLTIRCKSGACTFVAEVGENAAPVPFKVVQAAATGFRVENPEHDFPKYVAYSLESPKNLYAEIGDGKKKVSYRFERVR